MTFVNLRYEIVPNTENSVQGLLKLYMDSLSINFFV